MKYVLLILLPPIPLFLIALLLIRLPLPAPFPPAMSAGRNLLAAVVVGGLGLAYLVGLIVYTISSFSSVGRFLDPVMLPLGLRDSRYGWVGRRYEGTAEGQRVEITYMPGQAMRRPLLQVYLDVDLQTRMAIGTGRPLLDCRACPQVAVEGFSDLEIYAQDEAWARRWLSGAVERDLVQRLMADQRAFGARELYLQPGRIWFRAHPTEAVTAEQIGLWFDDLLALAATTGDRR